MSRIVDTIRNTAHDGNGASERTRRRKGSPEVGVVAYFHFEDHATVERVMDNLESLGVRHLRTAVSWADHCRPTGPQWYEWLLPQLVERFTVVPCVLYTPPSLGIMPKSSSPPREPEAYAAFVGELLSKYEGYFEHIELWNEPNNYIEWDWTVDPEWKIFAEMVAAASRTAADHDVRAVLGGMSPLDPNWINLMYERGAMSSIDVIGIHGFPGTWEAVWSGWASVVDQVLEVAHRHDHDPEIWITECGFSTWAHDEFRQVTELVEAAEAPVSRAYWYSAEDLAPERATLDGFHCDERAYHFGLFRKDGSPKVAARLWGQGGLATIREMAGFARNPKPKPHLDSTLITGGAGFVGTNLADALATDGKPVTILDSLARPGVEGNLRWLKQRHGDLVRVELADVRDRFAIRRALEGADQVFHLAAQVAVTTSLEDPMTDRAINIDGTLGLLEELRRLEDPPPMLFTSTNKVYGALSDIELVERELRYEPADEVLAVAGIDESRPLQFCSPYGCSKGAADQYVLDHAKSFGLPTVVFRMSCIYGPRQLGTEDQGWVAHFLIQALKGEPITVFGDGKQIRDLLFVDDLVSALRQAINDPAITCGRVFNIGGGPGQTASLLEIIDAIEGLTGRSPEVTFAPMRTGDQRYYVSDVSSFTGAKGWEPRTNLSDGLQQLFDWLARHGPRIALPEPIETSAL